MNFGHLLEKTYEALGFVRLRSVATGGSATTIVDTSLATQFGTNAFRKHIFFISTTTDGASPQNKFGVLPTAHYVAATQTFTIPTVTDAVQSGDEYVIAKPTLELYEMKSQVNNALKMLPAVRLENTSLSVVSDTYEYTLPIATKGYEIQDIFTGNADDGWTRQQAYNVRPASGGSTETLVFNGTHGDAGDTIRIVYLGKPTTLTSYNDTVSEKYADELVYSVCAFTALKFYMTKKGLMINRRWTPILQEAEKRYRTALIENPVRTPPRVQPKTILLGRLP